MQASPNPFFGARTPKTHTVPVNIKDDFNPFKHNKVVKANEVRAYGTVLGQPPKHTDYSLQRQRGPTMANDMRYCFLYPTVLPNIRHTWLNLVRRPFLPHRMRKIRRNKLQLVAMFMHLTLTLIPDKFVFYSALLTCCRLLTSVTAYDAWNASTWTTWCLHAWTVYATHALPTRYATSKWST